MKLRGGEPVPVPVSVSCSQARDALAAEVGRVTHLLRSVRHPGARALGRWTVAEVAMHLSQAWVIVPGLAEDDLSRAHPFLPHLDGTAGASLIKEMWDLPELTISGVNADPERDLTVLADRIAALADAFVATVDAQSVHKPHAWLVEGVTVDLLTLLCHLLNETIVHGYDIARADGRRWPIPAAPAVLVLEGFLLPVVSSLGPRTMVDQVAASGLRATFELHVRGGGRHLFVFNDGSLLIERPGTRRVDCHISADPVALLLLAWARRSQWPAIARGQIVAWGRRPWLGPRFRSLMRSL